jgi:hypothetical protein
MLTFPYLNCNSRYSPNALCSDRTLIQRPVGSQCETEEYYATISRKTKCLNSAYGEDSVRFAALVHISSRITVWILMKFVAECFAKSSQTSLILCGNSGSSSVVG